jgi:hypothetical protein
MKPFTPPPQALRKAKLDNLVLVPASLLPQKGKFQAIANDEPLGTTFIILPPIGSRLRSTVELLVDRLHAKGKLIKVMANPAY